MFLPIKKRINVYNIAKYIRLIMFTMQTLKRPTETYV